MAKEYKRCFCLGTKLYFCEGETGVFLWRKDEIEVGD